MIFYNFFSNCLYTHIFWYVLKPAPVFRLHCTDWQWRRLNYNPSGGKSEMGKCEATRCRWTERETERDSTSGACPPHLWPSGHMTTHTWIARGRLPIKVLQTWICGRRRGHAPWQLGSLTLSVISTTRCRAITCSLSSRLLPFKSFSTRCRLGENKDEKRENGREVFFSHPPPSER